MLASLPAPADALPLSREGCCTFHPTAHCTLQAGLPTRDSQCTTNSNCGKQAFFSGVGQFPGLCPTHDQASKAAWLETAASLQAWPRDGWGRPGQAGSELLLQRARSFGVVLVSRDWQANSPDFFHVSVGVQPAWARQGLAGDVAV